jgi:aldose 1-epimerase
MSALHVIENELWQVGLLPATGMSTAFGRIRYRGQFVDFMRPTAQAEFDNASHCASYILVPWSNRVAGGEFRFRDKNYRLKINSDDGTAMHGVVKNYSWNVDAAERTRLAASFDSRQHADVNYPFAFTARAELSVEGPRFTTRIWLKNESQDPMPAGLGHHPYFQRTLASANDEVRLEIPCESYFPAEKCIPTGPAIPVDARVDFRDSRSIGDLFIDDCLTGRKGASPVVFSYPESNVTVWLDADDIFEQVVFYAPIAKSFFAVEPVSNANDGFNLLDKGVPGSGVFVLEPGQERSAAFTLERRDRG